MIALLSREISVAFRAGGGGLTGLLFYLAIIAVFPFAIGPDTERIRELAPAILWVGALLASLLGLDRLFAQDIEDGALDTIVLQSHPLMITFLTKAVAHWITTGLPVIIATPVFAIMLNIDFSYASWIALTLLIGTPAITFIGLAGASVAARLPRGGVLIAVLVLPLAIPILIFGMEASRSGNPEVDFFSAPLLFLGSLSLFTSVLGPLAAAIMLRHSAD